MRRLLIVSPRFPPKNSADLHRVRTSLQYYRKFGWEPTVLCLTPETCDGVYDPVLEDTVPASVEIIRVAAWSERSCRRFGFGHIDYRCLVPLYRAGTRLLQQRDYDIVFFSTTVFLTFPFGPLWKRQFGCRIVYDFQDPWRRTTEQEYTKKNVPGQWWKYRLGQALASGGEAFALRGADHVISVSEGYVAALAQRYPYLHQSQFSVIPFGAEKHDFDLARRGKIVESPLIIRRKGRKQWIYAGRAGPDMFPILNVFFRQFAQWLETVSADDQPFLHFVGTNYAPAERSGYSIVPIAAACGLQGSVAEHPIRLPYHQILAMYEAYDAALIIGSIHAEYMPSKLFNCVLSEKPVLALFHSAGAAAEIAGRFPNVFLATFAGGPDEPAFANNIAKGLDWIGSAQYDRAGIADAIERWSAESLTRS